MKVYEVRTPVTLKHGRIAFDEDEKSKGKSLVSRLGSSLKPLKGKKGEYQITADICLKRGVIFAFDGNLKPLLGKHLVCLDAPEAAASEDAGGEPKK